MKRFVFSVALFAALFAALVACTYVWAIVSCESQIKEAFSHFDNQDVLFLGSSQIGCGIVESPQYHNKVIWTSGKTIQSVGIRLSEMERRGLLSGVTICFIRLNALTVFQQFEDGLNSSWYDELPISWRYGSWYPVSCFSQLKYALSHLKFPFSFSVRQAVPTNKVPICERDVKWRKEFFSEIFSRDYRSPIDKLASGWRASVERSLCEIKRICEANGIRLIALDLPILPQYEDMFSAEERKVVENLKEQVKCLGIEVFRVRGAFDEESFFDEGHLTAHAAERYTKLLYSQLGLKITTMRSDPLDPPLK